MYHAFSKITWVMVIICIFFFTKAKSVNIRLTVYMFILFICHFDPKLRRHNACVLRSGLEKDKTTNKQTTRIFFYSSCPSSYFIIWEAMIKILLTETDARGSGGRSIIIIIIFYFCTFKYCRYGENPIQSITDTLTLL